MRGFLSLIVFVFLLGQASALILTTDGFFPKETKETTIGGVKMEIGMTQVFNNITKDYSEHFYRFRIENKNALSVSSPTLSKTFETSLTKGEMKGVKFYSFNKLVKSDGENFTIDWTETAFDKLTLPGLVNTEYLLSFQTDNWVSGKYNITFGTSGALTTSFKLDPDVSACGTLSTAGATYTMTADIDPSYENCLEIAEHRITIDCNGHLINGTGTTGEQAVYNVGYDNLTVKNCVVTNQTYGIFSANNNNSILSNITANSNTFFGIFISSSPNSILSNITANSNTFAGILLTTSSNSILSNITANSNDMGIYLDSCSSNNLTNITANNNQYGIYLTTSSNNTLSNITADSNGLYGIYIIYGSINNTITNSTFSSNTVSGIYFYIDPEDISYSENNTFLNNTIQGDVWVQDDTIVGNFFNDSNSGNIYKFANGTDASMVFDITCGGINCWATGGSARPFNSTNTPTYWVGASQDWHPWVATVVLAPAGGGGSGTGGSSLPGNLTCSDGTPIFACSNVSTGKYCGNGGILVENTEVCPISAITPLACGQMLFPDSWTCGIGEWLSKTTVVGNSVAQNKHLALGLGALFLGISLFGNQKNKKSPVLWLFVISIIWIAWVLLSVGV
jgi:parallel beta-helix repeat protein